MSGQKLNLHIYFFKIESKSIPLVTGVRIRVRFVVRLGKVLLRVDTYMYSVVKTGQQVYFGL